MAATVAEVTAPALRLLLAQPETHRAPSEVCLSQRLGLNKSSGQLRGKRLKILGKPNRGIGHRSVLDVTSRSTRLLSEPACLGNPARDPSSHSRRIPGHAENSS
jgi:hypothetical protein